MGTLLLYFTFLALPVAYAAPPAPATSVIPTVKSVLPFIEDDFAAAKKRAEESGRLLVVDAWAPWCHTCLSMRNFVFTDAKLAPLAERFVYLAVDTEQPKNADFVARYPISSWPTMLVLDMRGNKDKPEVVARYSGSMTAPELYASLDGVLKTFAEKASRKELKDLKDLAEADAAAAAGNHAAAAVLYARDAARPELRSRARLGQISELRALGQFMACAELGDSAYADVGNNSAATDFFAYAADCLDHVTDLDAQTRMRQRVQRRLLSIVRDPRAPLAIDDRSDGFGTLIALSDSIGDTASGDRYAEERLQLLEAAAAQQKTPLEAATFDAHRFDCYRRLKRYKPAEAMLTATEKLFPNDYNPPARLARLYFEMGKLDEALVRIDRAVHLANGPRRISMLELKASIQHGLGHTRAAIGSLEEAIRIAAPGGSASGRLKNRIEELRKHIEALQTTLEPAPETPIQKLRAPKVARRDTGL